MNDLALLFTAATTVGLGLYCLNLMKRLNRSFGAIQRVFFLIRAVHEGKAEIKGFIGDIPLIVPIEGKNND